MTRHLYILQYRRKGWKHVQVRYYQRPYHLRLYVDRLLSDGRPDLAPIVELTIDRRELGPPVRLQVRGWDL